MGGMGMYPGMMGGMSGMGMGGMGMGGMGMGGMGIGGMGMGGMGMGGMGMGGMYPGMMGGMGGMGGYPGMMGMGGGYGVRHSSDQSAMALSAALWGPIKLTTGLDAKVRSGVCLLIIRFCCSCW